MTRSAEDFEVVQGLISAGANNCQIVRLTGVPLTTVRRWRAQPERVPRPELCPRCGNGQADRPGYANLLGLYLGDGHIVECPRAVFKLSIYLDRRYPGIVTECRSAMGLVRRDGKINRRTRRDNCVEVYSWWKHWPCLFPQHGAGMKHLRRIELQDWQAQIVRDHPDRFLRGLIHSDGSRMLNRVRRGTRSYAYPRYQFTNLSADIRHLFCCACEELGVSWRQSNACTVSVSRSADVARLDEFVGPKM